MQYCINLNVYNYNNYYTHSRVFNYFLKQLSINEIYYANWNTIQCSSILMVALLSQNICVCLFFINYITQELFFILGTHLNLKYFAVWLHSSFIVFLASFYFSLYQQYSLVLSFSLIHSLLFLYRISSQLQHWRPNCWR